MGNMASQPSSTLAPDPLQVEFDAYDAELNMGPCVLLNVPTDVLLLLCQYLDLASAVRFSSTCRRLRDLPARQLWGARLQRLLLPEERKSDPERARRTVVACRLWDDPAHVLRKRTLRPVPDTPTSVYALVAHGDQCYLGTFGDDMHECSGSSASLLRTYHVSTNSSSDYRTSIPHGLLLSRDHGVKLISLDACRADPLNRAPSVGIKATCTAFYTNAFDWVGCVDVMAACVLPRVDSASDEEQEKEEERPIPPPELVVMDVPTLTITRRVSLSPGDDIRWDQIASCGMGSHQAAFVAGPRCQWIDHRTPELLSVCVEHALTNDAYRFSLRANGQRAIVRAFVGEQVQMAVFEQRMPRPLGVVTYDRASVLASEMDEAKLVVVRGSQVSMVNLAAALEPQPLCDLGEGFSCSRVGLGDNHLFFHNNTGLYVL